MKHTLSCSTQTRTEQPFLSTALTMAWGQPLASH